MNWDRNITPIELGDGSKLRTLAECRDYIRELPEREQGLVAWRGALGKLKKGAEFGCPFLPVARNAFLKALQPKSSSLPALTHRKRFAAKRARWAARKKLLATIRSDKGEGSR